MPPDVATATATKTNRLIDPSFRYTLLRLQMANDVAIRVLRDRNVAVPGWRNHRASPIARSLSQINLRSDLNAARSSALNSSGCSQAAKWPPLSTSLK